MSTPRIETLLVSLVVLIATGIALVATYVPPAIWTPHPAIIRKTSDPTIAAHEPPKEQIGNIVPASPPASVVATLRVTQLHIDRQVAVPAAITFALLLLAVVVRRSRRAVSGWRSVHRADIRSTFWQWHARLRPCVQWRSGVFRRVALWTSTLRNMARLWVGAARSPIEWLAKRKRVVVEASPLPAKVSIAHNLEEERRDRSAAGTPLQQGKHQATIGDLPDVTSLHVGRNTHRKGTNNREVLGEHNRATPTPDIETSRSAFREYCPNVPNGAMAAGATILNIYNQQGFARSVVTCVEASVGYQRVQVRLMIAAHPDESYALAAFPEQMQALLPGSKAQWQHTAYAQPVLAITLRNNAPVTESGQMLLPVARRQSISRFPLIRHGTPVVSFLPLRTWRHISIYGSQAIETASSSLIDLLYAEAPDALALSIIDRGQISSLFQGAPHLVPVPDTAAESLSMLGHAVRHAQPASVRPLLLVVVEPSATMLNVYGDLVTRLMRHSGIPVYTILVRTHTPEAIQQQHPLVPAVMTGDETERLVSRSGRIPRRKTRIIAPHMRLEGECYTYHPTQLAALTTLLRVDTRGSLPPTVWDIVVES